ncbi:MAG TPA: IS110 family transposase [Acidimicrobiales bacterium]|nr:IS110 family transposase [Acidimicrobiales bacterium]
MIFVGDDWSVEHHDIEIQDDQGRRLAKRRLPEGVKGIVELHALVAAHAGNPAEVALAIETDRGLWPAALVAAGYQVYAVNPKMVARYRERHSSSGAKSDPADAAVLADLVRTDRHKHRQVTGDSELAEGLKMLTRAHQRLVWSRHRQVQQLRAVLREFYPAALVAFATDLGDRDGDRDALAVLDKAPTPAAGRGLSRSSIAAVLRRAGRRRNVELKAAEVQAALRSEQLVPPETVARAYGAVVRSTVAVIAEMDRQLDALETELADHFGRHPDAEIIRSQPGLGVLVGARLLGEFGDDLGRYPDAKARRNYAGTSPVTVASGKLRVVRARYVGNHYLTDACYWWAFCALAQSAGARVYYDQLRARKIDHPAALRALANRLVGILDGCLRARTLYDEEIAWGHRKAA